jgi:hypothetical protein
LGRLSSFANFVTPTILKPVWQMHSGEDALGRNLSPDQASMRPGDKKAPSQNYWNSASPSAVAFSDFLHRYSGGEGKHIEGMIEFPPGQISNFVQNVLGGFGSFAHRTGTYLGEKAGVFAPKADLDGGRWGDIPLVRRFMGDVDDAASVQSQFLDAQERINSVGREFEDIMQHPTTDSGERMRRLMDSHNDEVIAYQSVKGLGKEYSKIGKAMHSIEGSEMDDTTKREVLASLKSQRTMLQRNMLKLYHQFGAN